MGFGLVDPSEEWERVSGVEMRKPKPFLVRSLKSFLVPHRASPDLQRMKLSVTLRPRRRHVVDLKPLAAQAVRPKVWRLLRHG
jgi:hypothetical protein